jgi:hypothetical protein
VILDAPAEPRMFYLFFTRVNSRPFDVARIFRDVSSSNATLLMKAPCHECIRSHLAEHQNEAAPIVHRGAKCRDDPVSIPMMQIWPDAVGRPNDSPRVEVFDIGLKGSSDASVERPSRS